MFQMFDELVNFINIRNWFPEAESQGIREDCYEIRIFNDDF